MEEQRTYRLDSVEGKEPLATGYKILNWDWTGQGSYCYADDNGIEGSIHTVTGKISPCNWGLHFCKNPLDCLDFYGPEKWNRFVQVTAFDEIVEGDRGKTAARTLRIDKVLSWDEYIEALKTVPKKMLEEEHGISSGYGICSGYGIRSGSGITAGYGITDGSGISYGSGIRNGYGIFKSMFCEQCKGISRCIFAYKKEGAALRIFNKKVSVARFDEVWAEINRLRGDWYPAFTNAEELRKKSVNQEWQYTPAYLIEGRDAKEAYADMPKKLTEYIKALPEYDEKIFNAITRGEEETE